MSNSRDCKAEVQSELFYIYIYFKKKSTSYSFMPADGVIWWFLYSACLLSARLLPIISDFHSSKWENTAEGLSSCFESDNIQ